MARESGRTTIVPNASADGVYSTIMLEQIEQSKIPSILAIGMRRATRQKQYKYQIWNISTWEIQPVGAGAHQAFARCRRSHSFWRGSSTCSGCLKFSSPAPECFVLALGDLYFIQSTPTGSAIIPTRYRRSSRLADEQLYRYHIFIAS